jgi:hypothetical protein
VKPILPLPQQQKRPPPIERFGGAAPFQHHQGSADAYFGSDIDDSGNQHNFYVA